MPKANIGGLTAILQPDSSKASSPNLLTLDDLATMPEIRFVEQILGLESFNSYLLGIQSWMQWAAGVGLNPELVGLEDCALCVVQTKHDPVPSPVNPSIDLFVSAGPLLVIQNKATKRYNGYGMIAPIGVTQDAYNRTTALDVIALGKEGGSVPVAADGE